MSEGESSLCLAYYGDDYTGSTDALEGLALNGVRAVLFFDAPSPSDLDEFDRLDAIGLAGRSRAMSPSEMDDTLPEAFRALSRIDAPIVHYKVCSTFDSAPEVGSIGHAIDIAQDVFDSPFVPVSQGTESPFGRYVVFGNLFAVQDGVPYRIDRHPTMSEHPVTPMHEADIRRHLGAQTDRSIGLVDVRALDTPTQAVERLQAVTETNEIVVLDALTVEHLHTIGDVLWDRALAAPDTLFAVGSSGLEHHALPQRWAADGRIPDTESLLSPQEEADQIAVISGSAAPVTADQIRWATNHDFEAHRLDTVGLVDPETAPEARRAAVSAALDTLESGQSVILYSAKGPADPAIDETTDRMVELDVDVGIAQRLGHEQGRIFAEIIRTADLDRGCVAGGDTSGYVVPELEVYALDPIASTQPGAPLCRAMSRDPDFDGLELTLKGGQTGSEEYFDLVRTGGR